MQASKRGLARHARSDSVCGGVNQQLMRCPWLSGSERIRGCGLRLLGQRRSALVWFCTNGAGEVVELAGMGDCIRLSKCRLWPDGGAAIHGHPDLTSWWWAKQRKRMMRREKTRVTGRPQARFSYAVSWRR